VHDPSSPSFQRPWAPELGTDAVTARHSVTHALTRNRLVM